LNVNIFRPPCGGLDFFERQLTGIFSSINVNFFEREFFERELKRIKTNLQN